MSGSNRAGYAAGVGAYAIWGALPVFLKALSHVPPVDVLSARVLASIGLCVVLLALTRRWHAVLSVLRQPRLLGLLAISAAFIASNWLIYILAINHHHIVEASLGYFINPLINVLMGVVLLKERLSRGAWAAIAIVATGVVVLGVETGKVPWVALGLAITFSIYGLVRKFAPVDPLSGFTIETMVLAPIAIGWLLGASRFDPGADIATDLLLLVAGPITGVPLMLFAYAARRLPLTALGLLQYMTPTVVFLLGVFLYGEPLGRGKLIAFMLIWLGLAVYIVDSLHQSRARALAKAGAVR